MIPVFGPYNDNADVEKAPLAAAIRHLNRQPTADGRTVAEEYLRGLCSDMGMRLGTYDLHAIRRIVGELDAEEIQVIVGMLTRAYAAGKAGA